MGSIFELDDYKKYETKWSGRRTAFDKWRKYYEGTMYDGSAAKQGLGRIMQGNTQALFLPLARAVALDVALVPGGWRLEEEAGGLSDELKTLWRMSNWRSEGNLYVEYGASLGQSVLRVVDDWEGGRIMLQAFRPDTVLPIYAHRWGRELEMAIVMAMNSAGKEEADVVAPEQMLIFVDGVQVESDPTRLAFVPFVAGPVIDVGEVHGEPTFKRSTKALDKVNELASYLSVIIKKHAEPQWAVLGDVQPTELEKSGEHTWFIPGGADVKAIVAAIDIDGVRTFVDGLLKEMKDSLPELNVSQLVGVNRVAAATIELQMSEATAKVRRIRDSLDECLAVAVRMAGRAAAEMGGELSALAVLDDELLAFDRQRPVFSLDALTVAEVEQAQQGVEMGRLAVNQQRALVGDGMGGGETEI